MHFARLEELLVALNFDSGWSQRGLAITNASVIGYSNNHIDMSNEGANGSKWSSTGGVWLSQVLSTVN